ncbi:heat-inducible transcriptional repressor HrcA [Elusimicrobiota bacterium]
MRILDREELIRRKNRMLQTVILEFADTSRPVPSSVVLEKDSMGLSAATIRNIMHELEAEGLLAHPYTSAGRIPTDKGYRFYVNYLIGLQETILEEATRIEVEYQAKLRETEELLDQTSKLLAYLSKFAGFVVKSREGSMFGRLEFVPLEHSRVLAILITSTGTVFHRIIQVKSHADFSDLKKFSKWINSNYKGKALNTLFQDLRGGMEGALNRDTAHLKPVFEEMAEHIVDMTENSHEDIKIEGASNILSLPELSVKPELLRNLANVFENRQRFTHMLHDILNKRQGSAKDISVIIGREIASPLLKDLSLVSKTFETEDNTVGLLGILGPKRMEYGKMMALVEGLQLALQKAMNQWRDKEDKWER